MYMRISISVQSCESVPPAPAWMLTRAGWSAYGPENKRSTSCLPRSASRDFNSADSSLSRWPSFSAIAISARPARSFARDSSLRQVVTSSRKPFASWASRWPRPGSCQTPGSASSFWSWSSRVALRARSKMLVELEDLLQQAPGSIEDLLHQWPWQFLKRLPLPQGQMSFRPTPAKFQETGLLNGSTRPCMGPAPAGGATPAAEVSAAAAVPAGGARGGRTTSLTRPGLAVAAVWISGGRAGAHQVGPHPGRHRWRRRWRLLPDLHPKDGRRDVELDVVEQLLECLEGLVLVLDQRVLLAEGPQADALLEVFHHGQVADPLGVDGPEHDPLLDLAHHLRGELVFLGRVSDLGVL